MVLCWRQFTISLTWEVKSQATGKLIQTHTVSYYRLNNPFIKRGIFLAQTYEVKTPRSQLYKALCGT